MSIPSANPLFKHFRQPAIYLKLPSQGKFWNEKDIDLPVTGELPIYPMTVKDEITFKTPDALMNGSGVADVIQSCCPNIKNAWGIPATDLDPILIAIRMASYGTNMDITTKCPHCGEENENTVDLRVLLDNLPSPEFNPENIDGLIYHFKPQSFKDLNQINLYSFEQQKLIATITNSELSEEDKLAHFKTIFPKLTDLNIMTIINSIRSIVTEEGVEVSDEKNLKEFINNCEMPIYNKIKAAIEKITSGNKLKDLTITCSSCTKTYTSELNFEEANFFG